VASNRTTFTDPENGSTAYLYDTLNRLQTLTPPAAFVASGNFGFTYDALSRRTQMTRPNPVTTTYSYDTLSRLLSVTHKSGHTTLDGVTYTVDNVGNRLTRTPSSGSASTFSYDALYELTNVVQGRNTTTETYTYDPVGNRLSALNSSGWAYNSSNELTSRPTVTYTYDNNGNTQTKVVGSNTTSYAWDFENRLSSVTLPGSGGTVSFKYDPFGRRIYKSSSSATSVYAYDGDNLIEETNSTGGVVARYEQTQNIDEPLAMLRSSATSYFHADGLGSITSLSNSAGSIANTYIYDSYGNLTSSTGSLVNSFRYTGREFDSETGLYYYRARLYDPTAGRFISEDSLRFRAGVNYYRFVSNNPVNLTDPMGQYQLKGFTPGDAANMILSINQLKEKLKSNPCCIDPKLRDTILGKLGTPNDGSGVTFTFHQQLPAAPGTVTCGQVNAGLLPHLLKQVEIADAAFARPECGCLASTILHEVNHLTLSNMLSPDPGADSRNVEARCFGSGCH
jgi:RHS repeat-associated protein